MSADALPITPARFAAALRDLPPTALRLKVLELRNSLAHLDYSNEQLRPFAEGAAGAAPDPDCADAIRENEAVAGRMQERIRLVRAEVEARGLRWDHFQDGPPPPAPAVVNGHVSDAAAAAAAAEEEEVVGAGPARAAAHPAWADGTFQTGTLRDGEVRFDEVVAAGGGRGADGGGGGGSLTDEELRGRLEMLMRLEMQRGDGDLGGSQDDEEEGVHL